MNIFTNLLSLLGINPQKRVVFEDGSVVEWANRESIKVTLGDNSVYINFMFDWGSKSSRARTFIKDELTHWDFPEDSRVICSEDREKIIDLIQRYCEKKQITLTVE